MERSRRLLAVQVGEGMAREEVILVGLDLRDRGRMDMAIEAVGEALGVADSDHLLGLECRVVNGEEGSGYLKGLQGLQVEVVAIQEVTGEEAEEGIETGDTNISLIWATWVMAFSR